MQKSTELQRTKDENKERMEQLMKAMHNKEDEVHILQYILLWFYRRLGENVPSTFQNILFEGNIALYFVAVF